MSSEAVIVCGKCGSYKVDKLSKEELPKKSLWEKIVSEFSPNPTQRHFDQMGAYRCSICEHMFEVANPDEYVKEHPADTNRCMSCDKEEIVLVEKNHKSEHQPDGEITDLYECTHCHQKILNIVKKAPNVLYD